MTAPNKYVLNDCNQEQRVLAVIINGSLDSPFVTKLTDIIIFHVHELYKI